MDNDVPEPRDVGPLDVEVVGAKLISLSLRRTRTDYEPDRGACVGCARCFEFCPNELVRRGLMPDSALAPPPAART